MIPRRTPLRRRSWPQRRVAVRRVRPTLRRGEPSKEEKEMARIKCYLRAQGYCELREAPDCRRWTRPFAGHLHHLKGKRRYGWRESEATGQRHLWACPPCHEFHHRGGKPVPAKPRIER